MLNLYSILMSRCFLVCYSIFFVSNAEIMALSLPSKAQEIREGGMSFKSVNRDNLRMSSGAVSGLRAGGSASVEGGSINVGSASSVVTSVLNPIQNVSELTGDLFVAGDRQQWVPTLLLQRDLPSFTVTENSKSVVRGDIDPLLKHTLINRPNLIKVVAINNVADPSKSYDKVQFTEDYELIESLILAKDSHNKHKTNGLHIISLSSQSGPEEPMLSTRDLLLKAVDKTINPTAKAWHSGQPKSLETNVSYVGYDNKSDQNVINIATVQGAGSAQTHSRFSILGFSTNLNPNNGKDSQLSAFATNNKTVGSIRAKPNQTLQDIASQYGTTIEALKQVNNFPSADIDLSELNIVIPADLSTVGLFEVLPEDTPHKVAARYGINVAWLMDLNGLSDPGEILQAGKKLQIPGLRPLGSDILPPAKPLAAELEYADFGAYTAFELIYHVKGSLVPLFQRTLLNTLN